MVTLHAEQQDAASGAELLEQEVIGALRGIHDPEIPVNIYDLGLIYEIDVDQYEGDYARFEQQHCAYGHHTRDYAIAQRATFKLSGRAIEALSVSIAPCGVGAEIFR